MTKSATKTPAKKTAAPSRARLNLDGLAGLNLSDIGKGELAKADGTGKPLQLKLSQVIPDPDQPRKQFDADALAELAESIKGAGIKSPISVQPADDKGKYRINHGERRYRAAQLAKLKTIPAFIDESHDTFAQVIENIQRDNLKPMETANWILARLNEGHKQVEIADKIGKPKSFVSKHAALAKAPDFIQEAAESGRVTAVDALYDLTVFATKHPDQESETRSFLLENSGLSLADARRFIQGQKAPEAPPEPPPTPATPASAGDGKVSAPKLSVRGAGGEEPPPPPPLPGIPTEPASPPSAPKAPRPIHNPLVRVTDGTREGALNLQTPCKDEGLVRVRFDEASKDEDVPANDLTILAILEDRS